VSCNSGRRVKQGCFRRLKEKGGKALGCLYNANLAWMSKAGGEKRSRLSGLTGAGPEVDRSGAPAGL
jgi:hypothetical protein